MTSHSIYMLSIVAKKAAVHHSNKRAIRSWQAVL